MPRPPPPRPDVKPPVAVALQYQRGVDQAPRVVAKGQGPLADQIRAIALAHGVEVRQDSDLATLLAAVELDTPIPVEAFAAVAEILAYIYRANSSLKARSTAHTGAHGAHRAPR